MPQSLACVQPYGVQTPTGDWALRTQRTLAPQHVFGKPPLQYPVEQHWHSPRRPGA